MADLNKHSKSPTHMQDLFHCPNKVRRVSQFKILAGMFYHLESENCDFITACRAMREIIVGNQRLIGFS